MRKLCTLIALVVLVVVAVPCQAIAAPVTVRVMTYNIHAGANEQNVFDLRATAAAIAAERPDVVGLQEVDRHWGARSDFVDEPAELARLTGMHVFFAPIYSLDPLTPGAPRREFGVAVLSRTPLSAKRNLDITRLSTQDPNPVPKPAPGLAAVTTFVHGLPLRIYCTHLDYRPDPSVRAAQVKDMGRYLRRTSWMPQLLLGDMNAPAQAPELAPLHDSLADAWHGPGGETYPVDTPTTRIDQILSSRWLHAQGTRVPAVFASDHRPVVTTLTPR